MSSDTSLVIGIVDARKKIAAITAEAITHSDLYRTPAFRNFFVGNIWGFLVNVNKQDRDMIEFSSRLNMRKEINTTMAIKDPELRNTIADVVLEMIDSNH